MSHISYNDYYILYMLLNYISNAVPFVIGMNVCGVRGPRGVRGSRGVRGGRKKQEDTFTKPSAGSDVAEKKECKDIDEIPIELLLPSEWTY